MNRPTCGYTGHVCDVWTKNVQFISRYRNENDYCVGGKRVTVTDEGIVRNGTVEDYEKIRAFETNKYSDYLIWHGKQNWTVEIQPFTFPIEGTYV